RQVWKWRSMDLRLRPARAMGSMREVHRKLAVAAVFVSLACGKQPHATTDATTDAYGGANDASVDTMLDAITDTPTDALIGVLSPEPPDPVAMPCAGRLGFPGNPLTKLVDTGANSLDIGDFDGDGKADVVVSSGGHLQVATGTGVGTFGTPTMVATGFSIMAVRLADTNGDGKLDLIYGDRLSNNINVRLNNAS